jgi:hypothetical protein
METWKVKMTVWTAAASGARCRFWEQIEQSNMSRHPKALSPLRSASAVQNRRQLHANVIPGFDTP